MDDRVICLPWDKIFGSTPLGQTVVTENYGKFTEIYKGIRKYPRVSVDAFHGALIHFRRARVGVCV